MYQRCQSLSLSWLLVGLILAQLVNYENDVISEPKYKFRLYLVNHICLFFLFFFIHSTIFIHRLYVSVFSDSFVRPG